MKAKIISLAVAATIGLSACNSGGESHPNNDVDSATVSTATNMTLTGTSNKLGISKTTVSGSSQQGGISSFLVDSIFGTFAAGTLGFPGTWAASILSSVLFSWLPQQEDQTTVMLKEINEKLTVVLDGLKTNLNLTASIQDITAAVYTLLAEQGVSDSFTKFDDAITYANSEYQTYLDNNIFDSNESGNLSSMYTYAQNHCNDVAISTVLEASDDSRPDNQYKQFKSAFINSDSTVGTSSTYQKVVNAKTNYKSAIVTTLPKNADFMKYINEYNFDVTYYRWKTAGNFQKLYAMQMAQLAYHYACGNKITFTNLGNLPAGTGESGFNLGVELLNTKYQADFKQLESNMETYMPVISNSEIYTLISTKFSSSLLNSSSFNAGESTVGACSLSQMSFNSYTSDAKTTGIVSIKGICIASKSGSESNVKYESAPILFEIPYHTSTNTSFDRIGQSNLKYDSTNKSVSSTVSTDAMEADDVANIFYLRPEMIRNGLYWANKESMNILAPSWKDVSSTQDYAYRNYAGFEVNTSGGVQFYTDKFTDNQPATKAEEDYKKLDSDFSYGSYVPPYDYNSFTVDSNSIRRYFYQTEGAKRNWGNTTANPWERAVGWEYWILSTYNGKTFAVKLLFQHVAITNGWFSASPSNGYTIQAIGAYCLTSECARADDGSEDANTKTTLTWTDGTQVVFDTTDDIEGKNTGSYLYKTTATGSVNK